MSVTGLCEICEAPSVEHTCDRCGQLVCERHFDEDAGVCVECASEMGQPDRPKQPDDEDMPDGVDTYEF
ncbi:hypothetical protein [Halomicrobium salinisoli]|uniref:hypothetical protein n=1 Tax=Halomicrobium salinisoli TaxID=2878391 RepID=UPI001CF0CCED|nr:hypothetical protein [Halomicrobium salinisoli]